jgi:hypothetical protein
MRASRRLSRSKPCRLQDQGFSGFSLKRFKRFEFSREKPNRVETTQFDSKRTDEMHREALIWLFLCSVSA